MLDGYANALQKHIDALRLQRRPSSGPEAAGFSVRELEAWMLKKEIVTKGKVQKDRDLLHDPQAWGPCGSCESLMHDDAACSAPRGAGLEDRARARCAMRALPGSDSCDL